MRLVVIFGPPSVGKMTVGRAIAGRSRFRLFHNHAVLEPLLEVFDYGTEPFTCWVDAYVSPYVGRGAEVSFVELYADLDTRLERNRTEHRLAEKRSKRDLAWSDGDVRRSEQHVLSTGGGSEGLTPGERLLAGHRHLRLDTTALSAEETAEQVLSWLDG